MKTMKTWEMIKALTENPKKKFKSKCSNRTNVKVNGVLNVVWEEGKLDGEELTVALDAEWEEIQQPVPFMEAIEAYHNKKTIRCESEDFDTRYYNPVVYIGAVIKDTTGIGITSHEILNGKWYIEP